MAPLGFSLSIEPGMQKSATRLHPLGATSGPLPAHHHHHASQLASPSRISFRRTTLPNPLSVAAGQVGKVALAAVDHVAVKRFPDAEALYERALSAHPHGSAHAVSTEIIRRVARELSAAGAVSGAVAAAPGVGTSASLATGAADVGLAFGRLTSMVLAVGLAHGADMSDENERKRHAYAVLSGSSSQLTAKERKAGEMKKQLGQQALGRGEAATGSVGSLVTTKVGAKMLSKLATQETAIKLGSLLPLGFGAGVGAIGNRALVFSVGRTAMKYFTPTGPMGDRAPGPSHASHASHAGNASRASHAGTPSTPLRPVGQITSGGGTATFSKPASKLKQLKTAADRITKRS